jgi:hypothetical protein
MENISFCREWLPLDKKEFRILAMLADKGKFQGNLSDMCRYFSLNPQTCTRSQLRESIQQLADQGFIEYEVIGRNYTLRAVPKDEKIKIPRQWLALLRQHQYSSESVSWEVIVKVLLWLIACGGDQVIKNDMIATDLKISVSTVIAAKNVLQNEFAAITKEYVSEKHGEDFFVRIGQKINVAAWWATD